MSRLTTNCGQMGFEHGDTRRQIIEAVMGEDHTADKQLENLISATERGEQLISDAKHSSELESIEVMLDDQNELVDLDALFDALNVAARSGADVITYTETADSNTVLTVNAELLSNVMLDELDSHAADVIKDKVISDES